MSSNPPIGVPFRGSLIAEAFDVRVTERCLIEDFGLGALEEMANVIELPRGRAAVEAAKVAHGEDRVVASSDGHEHSDVLLWADDARPVVWVLGVADVSGREPAHPQRARLLPRPADEHRADFDLLAALVHGACIQAPLLLKRAWQTQGTHRDAFGIRPTIEIEVECDPSAELTVVRILRGLSVLPRVRESRLLAVLLAAFHADGEWEIAHEPGRGTPEGMTFRHARPSDVG